MMRFPFIRKKKSSSSKAAAKAIADSNGSALQKDGGEDAASELGSSLSSRSDDGAASTSQERAAFENGVIVKRIDDSVLLEQAEESLRSALDLIKQAQDRRGSWVDARDLLDQTAAALDDAGLALRGRARPDRSLDGSQASGGSSRKSGKSGKSGMSGKSSKKTCGSTDTEKKEIEVRRLADQVVDKRRSLLGDVLVHDIDGVWAKCEYGEKDGISFGGGDEFMSAVPEEEKENKALVVWASQTGTAKKFAKHLYKYLDGKNRCVLKNLKEVTVRDVAKYKRVYFICSTFGCGRPPTEGELFFSLLQLAAMRCKENVEDLSEGDESKPLEGTSVAIAALGSSLFKDFAKFGFGLAEELSALGATVALDVTTCDIGKGKSEQKRAFRAWTDIVVEMEKERLAGWVPTDSPKQPPKRRSLISKGAV